MTDNQNAQSTATEVPSQSGTQTDSTFSIPNDAKSLGLFAVGGALTAPFIGMGIVAGAVTGTAAYGVKRALFDASNPAASDPNQPSTVAMMTNTVSQVASQTVDTVSAWAGEATAWLNKKIKGATVSNEGAAAKGA